MIVSHIAIHSHGNNLLQEIDELLGQRLTEEDEDAVAAELAAIIAVSGLVLMGNEMIELCVQ